MKTKKKALLLTLCAVLLVVASVLGTMAYLTSAPDDVINTFTVGNVKITLDEAKVDPEGNTVGGRDIANVYKLMPGHTYVKDPTVCIVDGSEDCYVRMKVTIENYAILVARTDNPDMLPQDFVTWNSEFWECADYDVDENGNAVLEFRHNSILTDDDTLPALFNTITLPGSVTDMTGLENVRIIVSAEAIQADGFDDATDAFEALNGAVEATSVAA